MNLVLKTGIGCRRQQRCGVRNRLQQRLEPVRIGLGEVAQNIRQDAVACTRMADAEPDPAVVRVDMAVDVADAVMAAGAAAG